MARTASPGRRWMLALVGLVVLLAVVASFRWAVWLPNWRPTLRAGEQYGVDVSAHQGMVDWFEVARDGIGFAYVKATEGGDFTDARFSENWAGSREAGIKRGPYHFFTLCTPGAAQAAHFLAVAPPEDAALAPAVDLELAGNCRARPPKHDVDAHLSDFLSAVETAWNRKVVVYLGSDFEGRYAVRQQLGNLLWRQRFPRRPTGTNVAIWQLHGHARVEGIFGRVDLNIGQPARLIGTPTRPAVVRRNRRSGGLRPVRPELVGDIRRQHDANLARFVHDLIGKLGEGVGTGVSDDGPVLGLTTSVEPRHDPGGDGHCGIQAQAGAPAEVGEERLSTASLRISRLGLVT